MKGLIALIILVSSANSHAVVEDCHRKAKILNGLVSHHWIKTDTKTAGMGSGEFTDSEIQIGDKFEAPYATMVFVIDHSNQTAEVCKVVKNVDENCVDAELDVGKPLGRFTLTNNCQTYVAKVLKKCSTIKPIQNFDNLYGGSQ